MPSAINLKTLAGFFIIALCTLTFELLVSRVMSVIAWYHFAFMAICMALFGLTVGAVVVHKFKEALFKNHAYSLYIFSFLFSIALLVNVVIICCLPPFSNLSGTEWEIVYHPLNILIIFTSIALPLIFSGVVISLVFSKHGNEANRVYFFDLFGASLGCLLFIPLINFFGVVNSYIVLALLVLLAAFLFDFTNSSKTFLLAISVVLAFFLYTNHNGSLLDLHWAKGKQDNKAFYKKWNSFSYIRLMDWGKDHNPVGWGFAPNKKGEIRKLKVEQIYLDIDAIAGTVMSNFEDRDLRKIDFLKYDIVAMAHYLVHDGDMLVIGIGGARDILASILFDQKTITGVEINETILDIHQRLFAEFSGDLSRHPKVTFINNEARSYINSSIRKFDLIQLSLIDTFAATQAGAYALTENNLYTIEALKSYFDHLKNDGFISISYWMHSGSPEAMLKLTGTATKALYRGGISDTRKHIVIIHKDGLNRGVANLLVKKTPFSNEELVTIRRNCEEMGFEVILSPSNSVYDSFTKMSDIEQLDKFAEGYKLNISPSSDDKPFFFLLTKLDIWKFFNDFKLFTANAENILFSLLGLMLILTAIFVVFPLFKLEELAKFCIPTALYAMFFTSIGLAFMFIEMSQITRLSSFLGHPVYSLSIVLFSFLLSGGLGSYLLGRMDDKGSILKYSLLFIVISLLLALFTIWILEYYSKYSLFIRGLVSIGLVFPLGFFMGSFLPQGMRLLGEKSGPIALFWGLNGATSVLGSILAMILQITIGLNATFSLGIVLYIFAIFILFRLKFGSHV